ncbi:sulfotransferase [Aliiroseovarius sp. F20344]|uniref:sulfotransferase n=1 Tax=Aliiroseovarius sp. F20344 TaxID=2926414 RepID=UPI001FF35633|nr:sulfotransferase [Aliiroseovarius sp. F20344]MCK0141032.1 sulfotransferase [Aliiroseovarius sp. F20344]
MKKVLKSLRNLLQRDPSPSQIEGQVHIIASPYKTGSTSIGKSLIALGVGHREMPHDGALLKSIRPAASYYRKALGNGMDFHSFEAAERNKLLEKFQPLVAKAARYDIFHDAPMGHAHLHPFIRKILAPEARFIWVNRDAESWLESVRKWEISHPEIYRQHTLWESDPEARIANRLAFWKRHHEAFLRLADTFPEHCIELRWSDLKSYSALANFYQVPEPKQAFPHSNAAKS